MMRLFLLIYILLTFIGPIYLLLTGAVVLNADYRTANRKSAHIAPLPHDTPEAVIQAYSARAFNWRGLFSTHVWIAVKEKSSSDYIVYQVVGWRLYHGLPALMIEKDIPDRYWFDQKPTVILDIRGIRAENLIPKIHAAATSYPYPNQYDVWPGPNSNTLPAYIARLVPELQFALPPNAVGKDFLPGFHFFAKSPSGTGYQFSLYGLLGILVAKKEGIEINLLGLVYGIRFAPFAIIFPGIGAIP